MQIAIVFVCSATIGGLTGGLLASVKVQAPYPVEAKDGCMASRLQVASKPICEKGERKIRSERHQKERIESHVRNRWISEAKIGPYRKGALRVESLDGNRTVRTRPVDGLAVRRGFSSAFCMALRKKGKAPKGERAAQLAENPFTSEEYREKVALVYPGDVFLSGIPMIDQGGKAYCAVASAARVLQGYGIEITMDDMAELAGSSETGGTCISRWDQSLRKVAGEHGLELKIVSELTETVQPLANLLYNYNHTARNMGFEELYSWDYLDAFHADYVGFWRDREYLVQREVMLSSQRKCDAFADNVTARIDDSDPLFWCVTLGDVPEEKAYGEGAYTPENRGSHMRLIIGYNEERGEVLYSDSWGKGHELKRMDAQDALSITRGMYYLAE